MPRYVQVTAELARGWMSLAGAMGGHTVVAKLLLLFGTDEQKQRYHPRWRPARSGPLWPLTEPGGGSDLQNMRTSARRDGDHYVVNGSENLDLQRAALPADRLALQDRSNASPRHAGISILLVEHGPGLVVSRDLPKLGYKGVEAASWPSTTTAPRPTACSAASRARASPR